MKKVFCILILALVTLGGCGKSRPFSKSYIGFKIENQPEFSDLAQVNETFISPLYQLNALWFYSWNSPAEIKADDLLTACGMENYLKLTQNDEGLYSSRASAEAVETAIYERFGVNAEYLKTSQYYFKEDNTYQLVGGGGGGWNAQAISASQNGDILTIAIGILHPNGDSWKVTVGDKDMGDGFTLSPQGTLTAENKNGYLKYLSFQLLNN